MIPKSYNFRIAFAFFVFCLLQINVQAKFQKQNRPEDGSSREYKIPVIKSVDIVIIGGTVPAVSAAVSAAQQRAKVFLVEPRPYLGEDMCATLRLTRNNTGALKTELEKQIFGTKDRTSPLNVKAVLDSALIKANVEFIFCSYATDLLWDDNQNPAGVIINNRAGYQAVIAKAIIDATDNAWVCRMAGAEIHPQSSTEINFQRITILPGKNAENPDFVTHQVNIPMPDLRFPSFAKAEQIARAKTYTEGQLRASESLFFVPVQSVVCKKRFFGMERTIRN